MEYGAARLPTSSAGARLAVEGLHYAYDPDAPLLKGVTFDVEPGRTVAVVGATASGKSTLTSLMTRLVDPDAGRITVDDVDLRELARGRSRVRSHWFHRQPSSSTTPSGAT
ncbi:ATP-binding cassette domain-containing protein [Nocardioides sp. B-3]|nr:ATP-binding cassette domain-containing protein [Nocardioides sp. B-3]UUZ59613.1 ATP-binding cassette domain-containing protein [Nocardioides sp. B-3]